MQLVALKLTSSSSCLWNVFLLVEGEILSSWCNVAVAWWSTAVKFLFQVYLRRTQFLALKSAWVKFLLCSLVLNCQPISRLKRLFQTNSSNRTTLKGKGTFFKHLWSNSRPFQNEVAVYRKDQWYIFFPSFTFPKLIKNLSKQQCQSYKLQWQPKYLNFFCL